MQIPTFFNLLQTMFVLSVAICIDNIMPFCSSQPSDTEGNPEKWVNAVGKAERLNTNMMQKHS